MTVGPQDQVGELTVPVGISPLRLTVFGTSLSSAGFDWPDVVESRLAACLGQPVVLTRVTRPGANIAWAARSLDQVIASDPDLILMEFAINDADLRDGLWPSEARDLTRDLVQDLGPGRVVLLTMNPARGPRGVARPNLARHYNDVRMVAADLGAGLIDMEARWRALPRNARGLGADGLHPDPGLAREMIAPTVVDYVASVLGGCTPS